MTVLLTTHDLDEAEKLADRVVIVDHGRVLASGTPAELTTSGQRDEIRFGAPTGLDVSDLGRTIVGDGDRGVTGRVPRRPATPTPTRIAAITTWLAERDLALADLRAGRQRLEDVFLRLTEAAAADRDAAVGDPVTARRAGRGRHRSRRGRP